MAVGGSFATISSLLVFFVSLIAAGITFYAFEIGRMSRAFGVSGHDVRPIVLGVAIPLVVFALVGFFLGARTRLFSRRAALAGGLLQAAFSAFAVTMIQRQPRILTDPAFFPDTFILAVAVLSALAAVLCITGYLRLRSSVTRPNDEG